MGVQIGGANSLQALKSLAQMPGAQTDPTLQGAGVDMASWQGQPDALANMTRGNVGQPLAADVTNNPGTADAPPAPAPITRESVAAAARAGTLGVQPQVPGYYGEAFPAGAARGTDTVSRGAPASVPGATTPEGPAGSMPDVPPPARNPTQIPRAFMHRGGRRQGRGAMNGLAALSQSTQPSRT